MKHASESTSIIIEPKPDFVELAISSLVFCMAVFYPLQKQKTPPLEAGSLAVVKGLLKEPWF